MSKNLNLIIISIGNDNFTVCTKNYTRWAVETSKGFQKVPTRVQNLNPIIIKVSDVESSIRCYGGAPWTVKLSVTCTV